jgi:hypothetical protein
MTVRSKKVGFEFCSKELVEFLSYVTEKYKSLEYYRVGVHISEKKSNLLLSRQTQRFELYTYIP